MQDSLWDDILSWLQNEKADREREQIEILRSFFSLRIFLMNFSFLETSGNGNTDFEMISNCFFDFFCVGA